MALLYINAHTVHVDGKIQVKLMIGDLIYSLTLRRFTFANEL